MRNWISIAKDEFKFYQKGKVRNNEMSTKEKLMKFGFTGVEAAIQLFIEYKLLLFESVFGIVIPQKKKKNYLSLN